jgi:hypothetical protein
MTTEKTPTELPEPRAWYTVRSFKHSAHHFVLRIGETDWIHFWKTVPVAVHTGRVVYFSDTKVAAETRMVNELAPNDAHVRCDATGFDFIVGQVLCKAGLPLTQAVRP